MLLFYSVQIQMLWRLEAGICSMCFVWERWPLLNLCLCSVAGCPADEKGPQQPSPSAYASSWMVLGFILPPSCKELHALTLNVETDWGGGGGGAYEMAIKPRWPPSPPQVALCHGVGWKEDRGCKQAHGDGYDTMCFSNSYKTCKSYKLLRASVDPKQCHLTFVY